MNENGFKHVECRHRSLGSSWAEFSQSGYRNCGKIGIYLMSSESAKDKQPKCIQRPLTPTLDLSRNEYSALALTQCLGRSERNKSAAEIPRTFRAGELGSFGSSYENTSSYENIQGSVDWSLEIMYSHLKL